MVAAYYEATQLAGFSLEEATRFFGRPRGIAEAELDLEPKPAGVVQEQFLARFGEIAGGSPFG